MTQNFRDYGREQEFLLPPSLRDWLPEDHLAWFVIETVGRLDLAGFYAAYRADGHGRAAYDPAAMVCLLTYAYATVSSTEKRKVSVEPVFGHTKHNRKFTQFHRRGRGAVRTEWRLLMMTHNLAKLHSHHLATARA